MSSVPHIPVLRLGRVYESLDKIEVSDHRTGQPRANVSTVHGGVVRRDLKKIATARAALNRFAVSDLLKLSAKAGELFLHGTLPLGEKGHTQSADDYVATLSSTSGLPWNMVRRNMGKIHEALTRMDTVLNGLSRGLDLSILDQGF